MISVIIPTVEGREESLERCVDAYAKHTEVDLEIIVIENLPTCGEAWQMGADQAAGDYIHFSADDLEPLEGWSKEAIIAADEGLLPAPTIYGPSGDVEELGGATIGCTRIPFCTREQWGKIGPMIPAHYYTDNYFTSCGVAAGYTVVEIPTYAFSHHWAMAGRYGPPRMMADQAAYIEACRRRGIRTIP